MYLLDSPPDTPLPLNYEERVSQDWLQKAGTTPRQWFDTFPYLNIVGALLYLSLHTMPILAFAVNYCARFSSKPPYGACYCVAHIN
jgi:hypothetical protein